MGDLLTGSLRDRNTAAMFFSPYLEKVSEAIRAGRHFDLHCHSMSLQAPREDLHVYRGPGVIRIGSDRKLVFTMYADSNERVPAPDRQEVGELVPDDSVYRLSAIDQSECEWVARFAFPSVRPNSHLTKAIVSNELSEIYSTHPMFPGDANIKLAGDVLHLSVFDEIDIPVNTRTVTTRHTDGDEYPLGGASLDVAKLEVMGHKFTFTQHGDYLEIRIESPTVTPGLDKRVVEALQFVLARPIWWTLLCEERGDTVFSRIRSAPPPPHASLESHYPPIRSVYFHDKTGCVWMLFVKYFEHILEYNEVTWHPLSSYVYSAIEARAAGFDAYRLALGVAVEGILTHSFKDIYSPNDEFLRAVDDLEGYLESWKCSVPGVDLRPRLEGIFKRMRRSSSFDRLRALKNLGVVTSEELGAWDNVRNRATHGDRPEHLPTQSEIDHVDIVTTLLHKLVFQAIGYRGKYNDYGTRGFPVREFVPATIDVNANP